MEKCNYTYCTGVRDKNRINKTIEKVRVATTFLTLCELKQNISVVQSFAFFYSCLSHDSHYK